jgi:hypothetical protein
VLGFQSSESPQKLEKDDNPTAGAFHAFCNIAKLYAVYEPSVLAIWWHCQFCKPSTIYASVVPEVKRQHLLEPTVYDKEQECIPHNGLLVAT